MARLLQDRIYIGQIVNKTNNTTAPGEHQAIVSPETERKRTSCGITTGCSILLAESKYSLAPRTAGLWGIPDGFAVLCLQNLLIVEPGNHRLRTICPHCDTIRNKKRPVWGIFYSWRSRRDSNP